MNQSTPDPEARFRGALLGLACGDAVGTTVEFRHRGEFPPVTDMAGGGSFSLRAGEWTDDTSMALCLAASLVESGRFDPADQMERYRRWAEEGYLSSTGAFVDIGITVAGAILRYKETGDPLSGSTDPDSAGNGCIMRLAPVAMFYHEDWELAVHYSGESSKTTHGVRECVDACRLLGGMIADALRGAPKDHVLFGQRHDPPLAPMIHAIANGEYHEKRESEVRGTGYVVQSLEAALWCFHTTDDFEAAVLKAANLGDDADTTAAVCGQVAGAFYGEAAIPANWREKVALGDYIRSLADQLRVGPRNG